MARRKVPSQAASGRETFSDSLVGVQITDGSSQLTNTNFALDRAIPEKDSKNFRTSPFSDFLTLDTLKEEENEFSTPLMSSTKKSDRELRFRNAKNDAGKSLFGSLSRRLEVSIKNIIKKYPASFLIDKDSLIVTNQYTAYNISYDIDRDTTIFEVELPRLFNTFEIKLSRPQSNTLPDGDTNIRNFYSSFKKYVTVIKEQPYEIVDFVQPDSKSNFKLKIKGNPFSGDTTYTENILVRPNDGIVEEFYKSLDEIEEQLVNRETNPKFTAFFVVPRENFDKTNTNLIQVAYNWPLSKDGWNIKIIGSDFDGYLDSLKNLGDEIDNYKSNLFIRFLTSPQLYEFDSDEKKAESVFQLYGQSFDKIKKYIDNIAYMRNVSYDGINNLPDILLKNLAENLGLTTVSLFDEDTLDSALYSRSRSNYSSQSIGKNLIEAEYEFYRRLLVNLAYLYKSKGTRSSIHFFLRFLGAPEPLIRIDEYIYRVTSMPNSSDLENDIYDVLQRSKFLTTALFSPTTYLYTKNIEQGLTTFNREGYPVDEKTGLPRRAFDPISDIFFQKGSGWYDMTLKHRTPDILDEENSILTGRTKTIKTKAKPYSYGEEYFDVFRTLPGLDTGYGLDSEIDNVKASFYDGNSSYVLNRKNIEVYLSPSRAIDYDIWRKSRDLLLTFGSNTLYPQTGVTFAEFLEKTLHSQLKNSHVIRYKKNYIALEDVYTSYFTSTGFTSYNYIDSHEFIQRMSPYWMQILDQVIPATTLWTGGNLIDNNFFGRPKYKYNLGCQPKTIVENLYPNFGDAINEDLETILGEEENFRGLINITGVTYCPIIEIDGYVFSGHPYCVLVSGTTNTSNSAKLFNPMPMTGCTILPDSGTTALPLICDYKEFVDPDVDKIKELWVVALSGLVENVVNKFTTGYTAGYENYEPFLQQPNSTYTWEYKPKLTFEFFTDIDGKEKVRFTSIKYDFNDCSVEDYFIYRFDTEYTPINPICNNDLDINVNTTECQTDYCPIIDLDIVLKNNVGIQKGGFGSSTYYHSDCMFITGKTGTTSTGIKFGEVDNCKISISGASLSKKIELNFLDAANCETKISIDGFQKKYEHNESKEYYQQFVINTYMSGCSLPCSGETLISSQTAVTFCDNFIDCIFVPRLKYEPSYDYGLLSDSKVLKIVGQFPIIQIENGTIDYNAIVHYINFGDIEITNVEDVVVGDILLTATYKPCNFSYQDFKLAYLYGYAFTFQYDYNEVKSIECLGSVKKSLITGRTVNNTTTVIEVLPTTKLRVYTNKIVDGGIVTKTDYFLDERIPEHLQLPGETPPEPCCPYPKDYYENYGDFLLNVDGFPIEVIAVDLDYCEPNMYYNFNFETSGRDVPVGEDLIIFNGNDSHQVLLQHKYQTHVSNLIEDCPQQFYSDIEDCPTEYFTEPTICFEIAAEAFSNPEFVTVSPGVIVNEKPSYIFSPKNDTFVYYVSWSINNNRWEYRSSLNSGTLYQYNENPNLPIVEGSYSWNIIDLPSASYQIINSISGNCIPPTQQLPDDCSDEICSDICLIGTYSSTTQYTSYIYEIFGVYNNRNYYKSTDVNFPYYLIWNSGTTRWENWENFDVNVGTSGTLYSYLNYSGNTPISSSQYQWVYDYNPELGAYITTVNDCPPQVCFTYDPGETFGNMGSNVNLRYPAGYHDGKYYYSLGYTNTGTGMTYPFGVVVWNSGTTRWENYSNYDVVNKIPDTVYGVLSYLNVNLDTPTNEPTENWIRIEDQFGLVNSQLNDCLPELCFYLTSGNSSNFIFSGQSYTYYDGKINYMLISLSIPGFITYVVWNSGTTIWEHRETYDLFTNTVGGQIYGYLGNNSEYPVSNDTYIWTGNTSSTLPLSGISSVGECSIPSNLILPECSVLINDDSNDVYYYDYSSNTKTNLGTFIFSADIAHTLNKMWLYNSFIYEWDISTNPWSTTFNRIVSLPSGINIGAGLCAINDTKLLSSSYNGISGLWEIIEIDVSNSVATVNVIFSLLPTESIAGDIMFTTNNKILITITKLGGVFLVQYDYNTGLFETSSDLNTTATTPYGIFQDNGSLYVANVDGKIYNIPLTYPHTPTLIQTIPSLVVYGASQIPECCTAELQLATSTPTPTSTSTPTPTSTSTPTGTLPVSGLIWTTTKNTSGVTGCETAEWVVSPNNLCVRFNIADSLNCGGTCDITQNGTATATITVGPVDTYLHLSFSGLAELQDTGYENIAFYLDGTLLASATSQDLNQGCTMGPVIQNIIVPGPYFLSAGTTHTLFIDFTTDDPLFHLGSYYEICLNFTT